MAQAMRVPLPTFAVWMLWAGLWGALLAFWAYLHNAYRYGAGAEFF
jgi:hypothetical protein